MQPLGGRLMQPIERLDDVDVFLMHWNGGLRGAEWKPDKWRLLPVLRDGKPYVNGLYTKAELSRLMHQRGLRFMAFQKIYWTDGAYFSHWMPRVRGLKNFSDSPADVWGRVSSNLRHARARPVLRDLAKPNMQQIDEIIDDAGEPERLARSISLSLRSLDAAVEQLSAFYHEELINKLAAGHLDGHRSGSVRDQMLYAHIHSYFLYMGTARDYLAAFIALEIGMDPHKVNSMAWLVDKLRTPDLAKSALLRLLEAKGYIQPVSSSAAKWEQTGWLKQATDLRNEFVHKRTYGQFSAERRGALMSVDDDCGLFRYHRPIANGQDGRDILDVILENYEAANELLHTSAHASGYDLSIPTLTDDDFRSVEQK